MHTIDIRIGCDDYLIITQTIQTVFYIQCGLKQIELFVFINDLLRQPVTVQRFSTQTEYSLEIRIPAFGDGPAGRITLGNKDTRIFLLITFRIVQVNPTITEFLVMQVRLLSSFTGQFRYTGNRFTFLFRFKDLAKQGFRSICVLMQVVVEFFLDKVTDEFCTVGPSGPISFEPSLVFVWLSNTGSSTLILMAATIPARMSEYSKFLL